ncbi:MAG: YkyA family protein [Paenisporosarcina sp.]
MKKGWIGSVLVSTLFLSACTFGDSTQTQLTDVLSGVYEEEKGYRDAQKELAILEVEEQTTFNEVMKLTQKDKEQVTTLADELETSVSKRVALIEQEANSMENAQNSLSKFEDILKDSKDEETKGLEDLKSALGARYEAHEKVSKEYLNLAELQKNLYGLLPKEDTKQAFLQEQVVLVNEQNEKVKSAIDAFNESTKHSNELQEKVYSTLGSDK